MLEYGNEHLKKLESHDSASEPIPTLRRESMRVWLAIVYSMILVMVCIGGITRLTGSGLSMVEWHPLMGALPPLSEAAWAEVFTKYQASPQYQQVNHWMTLADFKQIFFWEYLHRLFGRLIGLVAFVPWLVMVVTKRLQGAWIGRTFLLIVLGGLQGLMGWYMVKSGLVDVPEVSHFRLAAHLSLAFLCALYALWLFLGERAQSGAKRWEPWLQGLVLGLVALQTVYGAFMAGKRAGWLAASFPDMHGHYLPFVFVGAQGWLHSALYEGLLIHWIHRALAVLVVLAALGVAGLAWRDRRGPALAVVATVLVQFVLGALTVVYAVPIPLAVAHQANALLLCSALVWLLHASEPAA